MAGGKAGGGPAAVASGGTFAGLTGVTAPLTGLGTGGVPLAIPAATNADAGHMTAAQVQALEALQDGEGLGWLSRSIARAAAKAGIADESQAIIVHQGGAGSFGVTQAATWQAITEAGGGISYGTTGRGGTTQVTRSVATGTVHYQKNTNGFIATGTGIRWYFRARVRINGTAGMGASAIIAFGASNNGAHTSFIDVGVVAANSTAKYSARITGTTTVNLTSTVNIDNANHVWIEAWCDGTNTFLSASDETPVSGAFVQFAAALKANLAYINDGTSGTRDLYVDRAVWITEASA